MKKLRIIVPVLLGLWVVVELAAPGVAANRVEARVEQQAQGASGVHAKVGSFGMVTKLMLTSEVSRVTIRIDEIARSALRFTNMSVEMSGVKVQRATLFSGDPKLESIASGTLTAELALPSFGGVDLGRLSELAGRFLDVSVNDGVVEVKRGGRSLLRAELPEDLFPCRPTAATEGEKVTIRCVFTEVPSWLVDAANRA